MNITNFNLSNDIVTSFLDIPSTLVTISSSAGASNSGIWAMVLNSTSAGDLRRPDTTGSATTISISSAFRNISNYLYGTGTYIIDANNGVTQNTTVRTIQFSRPNLADGLYKSSITAIIISSNTSVSFTAIDSVDNNSIGSPLGLTGSLINSANTGDVWGDVFYDHGIIVFNHSQGTTGSVFSATLSGFEFGSASNGKIRISQLNYKTRNVLKRSIYFCRALNKEYNYTFNPTARDNSGRLLSSLSSNPATFITTIGLYNDDDELVAVAKISPPKKKSFEKEAVFSVLLDF